MSSPAYKAGWDSGRQGQWAACGQAQDTSSPIQHAPTLMHNHRTRRAASTHPFRYSHPPQRVPLATTQCAAAVSSRFRTTPARRFGGGIPLKQYQLIRRDGVHMATYAARTFVGVAEHSHLRRDNYFYFNCCTGAR